jgi:hypothetical protein
MSLFFGLNKYHGVITEGSANQSSQYSLTVTFTVCSNSMGKNKKHFNAL